MGGGRGGKGGVTLLLLLQKVTAAILRLFAVEGGT